MAFLAIFLQATVPAVEGETQADRLEQEFPLVTNVVQLRQAASEDGGSICGFRLEGIVLATDACSRMIFFQDNSGAGILEMDVEGRSPQPGQQIELQGTNYVTSTSIGISLGESPVVDNDGEHSEAECAGTVYLRAGLCPIRVLWFNHRFTWALGVTYAGPHFARRAIPNAALFRVPKQSADGRMDFANGLDYACYEGEWVKLPRFQDIKPVNTGIVSNFDASVKSRDENVGLAFNGFIKIEESGLYTFYLTSDDGSELFVHDTPIQFTVTGEATAPEPEPITVGQSLSGKGGFFWAEAEGRVTFLGRQQDNRFQLELTSEDSHMRVIVCDTLGESPRYLLGSRVHVRGMCIETADVEGHQRVDALVVPSWKSVQVLDVTPDFWTAAKSMKIGDCKLMSGQDTFDMLRLCGKLHSHTAGRLPELQDDTGSIPLELLNSFPTQAVGEVECLGIWSRSGSNGILREAVWRELPKPTENKTQTNDLPVLTTAAQVQQLKREEAERGYQAKLEGVVTWVSEKRDCLVLQDSTRGVFVGLHPAWVWGTPRVGENLKIEGTCIPSEFSPIIILSKVKRLGMGRLPAPVHPTWEQLIGGAMDSQYVEIQGMVTASQDASHLTLLLPDGEINIEFDPPPASPLASLVDSVVSIRGVIFARWNNSTLQILVNHPVWFGNATICVDTPAPLNPFNANEMQAKQLMQFDVHRNAFQRVKVLGQFLYNYGGTCYMTDDGFGARFEPVQPVRFEPGDTVEVVGLVELGGASPVLREAVARKTGHLSLPLPVPLVFDQTNTTYDSSRVWVEGQLLNAKVSGSERVLEMQAGSKSFVARLPDDSGADLEWPVGSRLKLTGTFCDLGGSPQERQSGNSFELLLNSPADVELIARPPWWTLRHTLAVIGAMVLVILAGVFWILMLHRLVENRSAQLGAEIRRREQTERHRELETERARIARDLHDELGATLTQIRFLSALESQDERAPAAARGHMGQISEKCLGMVSALDEIVWAVNPTNDSLASLANYFCHFAEEFFEPTPIRCRLDVADSLPAVFLTSEVRHNLYLAVREALNNVSKYADATEVWLRIHFRQQELHIAIEDNGCGFSLSAASTGEGLANMRQRLEEIGGRFDLKTRAGAGTVCQFWLRMEPVGRGEGEETSNG